MKVRIDVILDVELCDDDLGDPKPGDPSEARILDSVQEGVRNALDAAQNVEITDDLEAELSVMVSQVGSATRV